MDHYLAIEKNEILPFVITWMDLEGLMLSEISQTEKDKYCMISLICGSNEQNNKQNRYREQTDHCQRGRGWGG